MENNLITVSGLCFGYDKGKDILHDVSVDFASGKITALLGANGSGKSTLLNLIAGIMQPRQGEILLQGQSIRQMNRNALAKLVSVVHQKNTAPADMTVRKLVSAGRTPYQRLFKGMTAEDEAVVELAMKNTEILDFADRPISALSGGQMQRVWLAMALAQDTEVLMLDEITTYLDIHYQLELLHLIREINEREKKTIIMVLHDINLAMAYCHEAAVMKDGCMLQAGDIKSVVSQQTLEKTFAVKAKLLQLEDGPHCIFSRKGDKNV